MLLDKVIYLFPSLSSDIQKLNYLKVGIYIIKDWIKQSRNVSSEASYREHNSLKQNMDLGKFARNSRNSWIYSINNYIRELQNIGSIGMNELAVLRNELTAIIEEVNGM